MLKRTDDSSELVHARNELDDALEKLHDNYYWMVEKYIGRGRCIPDHVPEMRVNDELHEVVWDRESLVRSLSGRPRDGDLSNEDAAREIRKRLEAAEREDILTYLESATDPLTSSLRDEIHSREYSAERER